MTAEWIEGRDPGDERDETPEARENVRHQVGVIQRLISEAAAESAAACYDCGRPYGDEHGFPDLVVPHRVWNEHISPTGDEGGLLCPSCMCKRAHEAGIRTRAFS